MTFRIPFIPTVIVIAAAATMVWLGFWQLGRAEEKADLLARYESASVSADPVTFPDRGEGEDQLFRRSEVDCQRVVDIQPVAGTAANGAKGWAIRAICDTGSDRLVTVDLGFARDPQPPEYSGGATTGIVAPGPRLVADPPLAGLQPLAKPNPGDLPNNHLAYAGQWFFFALTALLIYGFALRSRMRKQG